MRVAVNATIARRQISLMLSHYLPPWKFSGLPLRGVLLRFGWRPQRSATMRDTH